MLTTRIIPCLDVKDGRIVKGTKFQNLIDAGNPAKRAALYEREGADEIVILDVAATDLQREHQRETVTKVRRSISIPLTIGGGVRSTKDVEALLSAGADKVSVNSAAVLRPKLIDQMAKRFGSQCTIVAIDAKRRKDFQSWTVVVRSGKDDTKIDALSWAKECEQRGGGEILLTSWDKDGTGEGYDLDLIEAVTSRINIPVIASGGAKQLEQFYHGVQAGADALLAASVFHFNTFTPDVIKEFLAEKNVEVRRAHSID